ncbi:hypothetical protein [Tropicimonas sp. IMCC6043]|nr:hypothetical protein [Tropicimonas sp. IMCC6043]
MEEKERREHFGTPDEAGYALAGRRALAPLYDEKVATAVRAVHNWD